MRFGSRKVPFGVMVSVITLAGLGAFATFPTADRPDVSLAERFQNLVDPIITASVGTDSGNPTMTQMPGDLEAETSAGSPPRQVLPGANSDTAVTLQAPDAPSAQAPAVMPSDAMPSSDMPSSDMSNSDMPNSTMQSGDTMMSTGSDSMIDQDAGSMASEQATTQTPTRDMATTQQPAAMSADPVMQPTMSDTRVIPFNDDLATAPQAGLIPTSASNGFGGNAVILALDHARVMRLSGNVGTIIIGNPAIADAHMPDPQTVILTGKSYGETNLVLLDERGSIVAEQMLRVTVRGQSLVSVYRGVQRTTLSCSPTCEVRPTPGDNTDQINAAMQAFEARNTAASQAARSQ